MYIYLASQSPRRRELLAQIGVRFELLPLDEDETPLANEAPRDYVMRVCRLKAQAGWRAVLAQELPHYPVLTADTTVALGGDILGKPVDAAEAEDMLRRLSGGRHEVLSAVAVTLGERTEERLSVTSVTFAQLDDERIQRYVQSGEWRGKAGAYGIQGQAACFAQHIEGSYSGVMGLPLFETAELLRAFCYPAP
jgi:septum formation protein